MNRIRKRRREEALQKVADWEMLLAIVTAPYTERGEGVYRVSAELADMRRRIKGDPLDERVVDIELHRRLADLNRRRRGRREAG
ncbi:MAG: hypothetical protein BAA04_04855 [Firmicutes bacterium ZCTH02-B6]|nr:MAG: hypothetical protein BAA04_04855 [Firmicutes bacterium ZCTH02-B6]